MNTTRRIQLPIVNDPRGSLGVIESGIDVPFDIRRVYYLFGMPSNSLRGGHAHIKLEQLIIAISGSFDLTLDSGYERRKYHLNAKNSGILLPNMMWRDLDNFSDDCVCLVMASEHYDEADYIRDYDQFLRIANIVQLAS